MKIDYNFLKDILTVLVDNQNYVIDTDEIVEKLALDESDELLMNKFWGHMFILNDNYCLDCNDKNLGVQRGADGFYSYSVSYIRLTAQGYQFLDVLKNDNIFRKIKDFSVSTAIEIGKAALINMVTK